MEKQARFLDYFDPSKTPRDIQIQASNWSQDNWYTSKVLALNMSCGAGKSHYAMSIAEWNAAQGLTTSYITPQRILQSQLQRDFSEINLLMGAENYVCLEHPNNDKMNAEVSKSLGLCFKCRKKEDCPYFSHKLRAYNEYITIFNPMSFLFLKKSVTKDNEVQTIYDADTIIIDECQSVASMLAGAFDFKVWRFEHRYAKNISASVPALVASLEQYQNTLDALFNSELQIAERMKVMRTIHKLDMVLKGLKKEPEMFVVEETVEKYRNQNMDCLKVRVTAPPAWLLKWFFGSAAHIVLMSGTLFKSMPKELGFTDFAFLDLPSPIDKELRRFIPLSAVSNSHSNVNAVVELAEAIIKIANRHPKERGIVLASYEQAKSLKGYLDGHNRFVFHDKTDKSKVIEKFMRGEGADQIAVLSGAWEGLDAKDDLCRFIIITKCLFPNMADKLVLRKRDLDKTWYDLETMKYVIQGANRASRHQADFSVTYMLDANFMPLYTRTKPHLPKYFCESIKWGQRL